VRIRYHWRPMAGTPDTARTTSILRALRALRVLRVLRVLCVLCVLCVFHRDLAAQSNYTDIDRLFADFAAANHVPGAAWGIVADGRLVHTGAAGYRELTTRSAPNGETVFRIASMTKSFTAMAILALRDEGKLSLDDPAEKYVPELASLQYPTTDSPKITVRHLLSHSEGFPEDNPWGDQQLSISDEQLSAMLRAGVPFSHAPGLAYEYSNYGFMILGRIVSRVSGVPYAEYVTAKILNPLGMTSTTLEPSSVPADRIAHGYRWEDDRWKEERQLPNGAGGSMGGMLTSIDDLAKYVSVYLSAWPPHDGPETAPIRRASLREMQQMWRPAGATVMRDAGGAIQLTNGGYAFGLRVSQTCNFRYIVSHTGGLPGFGSIMQWLPDYGVGIIAFGNVTYTGWTRVVTSAFDALARDGRIKPRPVQPSPALVEAQRAVSQLVMRWDDALADRIAAGNLFLDQSKDRRRAAIEALRAQAGACRPPAGFDSVENALRGRWTLNCERANIQVAITLAPTMPPTVQYLNVSAPSPMPSAACSDQRP
ncbi:MAG TPA: serine hydrolase domain-containing protein, partial [Vicinamibacterales bacterium]|nr:serine hydrolase domain-containing protein [Vicinamibacterales bacterium]